MNKILVETSARHIHLTKEDLAILAGHDYELEVKAYLSQPGEFASTLRLTAVGPKGKIERIIVLGPTRKATQVEVSATDARSLGISAPVRQSGDVAGSAPLKIIGPVGEIDLVEGAIIAKRHVHMTTAEAKEYGVSDNEIVGMRIVTPERSLIFEDVVVRVKDSYALAMHIDTDESNAAGISGETYGELIKLQ